MEENQISKDLKKYIRSEKFKAEMNRLIAVNLERMEGVGKAFDSVFPKSVSIGKGYFFRTKWSP